MTSGLADVAERLMAEFEGRLSLAVISDIVRGSAHDLAGHLHPAAQPELVERSARQRLLARLAPMELAG